MLSVIRGIGLKPITVLQNVIDITSNICDGQRDGYQYIYAYKLEENKTCGKDVLVKVTAPHVRPDKIEDDNYQAPTCVTTGWIRYNCTVCDTADVYEVLEPWGHDYKAEVIDKADSDDDKYHLVYVCQRERLNDDGVLAPCAEKNCTVEYVAASIAFTTILEPTCYSEGKRKYVLTDENGGTTEVIEIIPKLIHKLNGVEVNVDEVWVFADISELENSGLKLFGNYEGRISCSEIVGAYFQCENCGDIIAVSVRLAHTPDESGVKETDDGYRHYTCDVCKDEIDEIIENRESAN